MSISNPSSKQAEVVEASRALRIERLAQHMYERREKESLTLDDVSQVIGISVATLSRFERWRRASKESSGGRRPMPDPEAKTLIAVSNWLGVSLDSVLVSRPEEMLTRVGEETPDVVEAYLRADKRGG